LGYRLSTPAGELFDSLARPAQQLFAKERSNLHKDDVYELDIIARLIPPGAGRWPFISSALYTALDRLSAFIEARRDELDRPLGLASNGVFGLLAYKLVLAADLQGGQMDARHGELMGRLRRAVAS
jgi:hypothetical protein